MGAVVLETIDKKKVLKTIVGRVKRYQLCIVAGVNVTPLKANVTHIYINFFSPTKIFTFGYKHGCI